MHGNKLNEGYWFRSGSYASESAWSAYTAGYGTENMLDWMYDNLDIEDTIIVTRPCTVPRRRNLLRHPEQLLPVRFLLHVGIRRRPRPGVLRQVQQRVEG